MQDGYVSNAAAVAKVGQSVVVRVLSVDAATGKIALTMKGEQLQRHRGTAAAGREN